MFYGKPREFSRRKHSSSRSNCFRTASIKKNETKKRRILTLEEKYKLVKAIKNGEKNTVAAKRFDPPLSQSTISTIMKKKDEIIGAYEGGLYADK